MSSNKCLGYISMVTPSKGDIGHLEAYLSPCAMARKDHRCRLQRKRDFGGRKHNRSLHVTDDFIKLRVAALVRDITPAIWIEGRRQKILASDSLLLAPGRR
jgi:hypothetical protein